MPITRAERRRRKRRTMTIIIALLISYLFLKPIWGLVIGKDKTVLPREEIHRESFLGEGFFIRSEKPRKSENSGTLRKKIGEGERISAGIEVADVAGIQYYNENAGLISYEIDGYEEEFQGEELEKYSYDLLDSKEYLEKIKGREEEIDPSGDMQVSRGQAIYKIIDNFEWYIAIKVENKEDIADLSQGQGVKVKMDGEDEESIVKGYIRAINETGDKAVLVVKFNTMLYKYFNLRVKDVELIKNEFKAFKIPTKSIFEKDGQDGVYIKNKGGIVEFRPVFLIKEVQDDSFIKIGDNSSNIYLEEGSDPIRTVDQFDEIILNHDSVKEGDIIG